MSKILHIKDAYFELSEKCKDDIGLYGNSSRYVLTTE
jgi:hypothetical protein